MARSVTRIMSVVGFVVCCLSHQVRSAESSRPNIVIQEQHPDVIEAMRKIVEAHEQSVVPVASHLEPVMEPDPPGDAPIPTDVDLRPVLDQWQLPPRLQGDRGTCSVFTIAGALEFAMAKKHGATPRWSIEYLNWAANQVTQTAKDGAFFDDIWKGFATYGVCPEADMPYQPQFDAKREPDRTARDRARECQADHFELHWIKRWNPETGLTEEEFAAIRGVLAGGWPACAGCRWPKKAYLQWQQDLMVMVTPEQVRDGHSVLLVGYRDDPDLPGGGGFIFRNSSHPGRDGVMSYEYARAYVNDAVWIQAK